MATVTEVRGSGPASGGLWRRLLSTDAPAATVWIRVVVGGIFVSEGVQKFLFPADLGPGRFATETPLPAPGVFAYLTGGFEIVCGLLLLVGLATRLAAIPMIVTMLGAEAMTKLPLLVSDGFFEYAHEARAELGQLFGSVFLLVVGAGTWSLDACLSTAPTKTTTTLGGRPPGRDDATSLDRPTAPLPADDAPAQGGRPG